MKNKVFVAFLLVVVLTCYNTMNALADEISAPPANQISSNPNYSVDSKSFPVIELPDDTRLTGDDGLQWIHVQSSISKASSSSITVMAISTANVICMDIGGTVRVKQWKNNSWETYCTFFFWGHGVSSCSATKTVSVEPGYYYKVTCNHTAITEQSAKYATSSTKSIYIN